VVPALPKINGQTMEPSSPLSSTNHRSLARFRSEVRPKIRKLSFAVAYLWICARRKNVQDEVWPWDGA
jgi:hypothetical protein